MPANQITYKLRCQILNKPEDMKDLNSSMKLAFTWFKITKYSARKSNDRNSSNLHL